MFLKRINRTAVIIAAALAAAVSVRAAATAPAKEMTLAEVLEAHCRAREGLESLRARFTQTRVYTVFDEREESAGAFAFRRPGMLRWQFASPDSSVTVIRGDSAWTVLPRIRQVQKMALGGSSTDRVMSIIGFGSCGKGFAEAFKITLKGTEGARAVLEMIPVAEDIAPYFSLIELALDPKDFLPRRIVFHEHSGDLMIFEFSDLRPGARVPASEFHLAVPTGYELVEY